MVVIAWQLDLPVESVPITTTVVSSNPGHGAVHSIQNYVITFVRDRWRVGGFLRVFQFPPSIMLTVKVRLK